VKSSSPGLNLLEIRANRANKEVCAWPRSARGAEPGFRARFQEPVVPAAELAGPAHITFSIGLIR
jgi:hypothetical protein